MEETVVYTFTQIIDMLKEFIGTDWFLWVIMCVCLVAISIKDKMFRYKLAIPAVLTLVIFLCPLVYKTIGSKFLRGVYWRMLWLIPMTIIIAYGGTCLYSLFKNRLVKLVALIAMIGVVGVSGTYILGEDNYTVAYNDYQINPNAKLVADVILADDTYEYKKIVVPDELLCDIRQYSSKILLMYGRNAYGYITDMDDFQRAMFKEMNAENPNYGNISYFALRRDCTYIVFNSYVQKENKQIEDYWSYEYFTSINGYDIYRKIVGVEYEP